MDADDVSPLSIGPDFASAPLIVILANPFAVVLHDTGASVRRVKSSGFRFDCFYWKSFGGGGGAFISRHLI